MAQSVTDIVMRYVHIVSAVLAVGGLCCVPFCVLPSLRVLDEHLRESLTRVIRGRFHIMLMACMGGLVISGAYNWIKLAGTYKDMGPKGNALIGTKVLVALVMFTVVGLSAKGLIKPKAASMINIHLAAVVILLAVVLRHLRLEHMSMLGR